MLLSGADIIVRTLIEQGCDTVFGYPGGQIINVYDSLYKYSSEIRHVLTAHEQGAAHAADGYARATGRVGVVIATSGPGATNLVTGIATAHLDSVPMVAITGNVFTSQIGSDSFQEIDITGVTLPITKQNYFVGSVDELADTIREAFRIFDHDLRQSTDKRYDFVFVARTGTASQKSHKLLRLMKTKLLPLLVSQSKKNG